MTRGSPQDNRLEIGIVILAGGDSFRMGRDKRFLPMGEQSLLGHLIEEMKKVATRLVISCQSGQQEMLSNAVGEKNSSVLQFVPDSQPNLGPIEGLRAGLQFLGQQTEFAFVTPCDSPLVSVDVIRFLLNQADGYQAVMPIWKGRIYGLTAIYRTDAADTIAAQINAGNRQVKRLAKTLQTRLVDAQQLHQFDPQLNSLVNLNTIEEYRDWVGRNQR